MINSISQTAPTTFAKLPAELQLHIFTFLDPKDLTLGVGLTCKEFKRLSLDDYLWKIQCSRLNHVSIPILTILSPIGRWKNVYLHPQSWNRAILRLWATLSGCKKSDTMFPETDPLNKVTLNAKAQRGQAFQSEKIVKELIKTLFKGPATYNNIKQRRKFQPGYYSIKEGVELVYAANIMAMNINYWCVIYREKLSWLLKSPTPLFSESDLELTVIDEQGSVKRWDVLVKIYRLLQNIIIKQNNISYFL